MPKIGKKVENAPKTTSYKIRSYRPIFKKLVSKRSPGPKLSIDTLTFQILQYSIEKMRKNWKLGKKYAKKCPKLAKPALRDPL